MAAYNPFKKPLGETLDASDLNDLITNKVAEGFYVEYKSQFVDTKKIARSLASFANTYGGWYFVGIEADKQDGNNVATRICGFELAQYPDPLAKILAPARQRLSHMPLMFPQLIKINETHAVVAVYIPEGMETPYITSEGTIYRRAADASDPIGERDRYAVDRLVDRGREEKENFADFCEDHREFSESESNVAWVNVYLRLQPRGLIKFDNLMSSENIENLLQRSNLTLTMGIPGNVMMSGNTPLNTGYPSGSSIVLRQTQPNVQAYNSLSIQLFPNGSCKLHIPIPLIQFDGVYYSTVASQKVKIIFQNLIENELDTSELLRFANFGTAAFSCVNLISFYLDWLKEQLSINLTTLWVRVTVDNAWRLVPVIDTDLWADYVEKFGLPISYVESISIPTKSEDPSVIEAKNYDMLWSILPILASSCLGFTTKEMYSMLFDELNHRNQPKDI